MRRLLGIYALGTALDFARLLESKRQVGVHPYSCMRVYVYGPKADAGENESSVESEPNQLRV